MSRLLYESGKDKSSATAYKKFKNGVNMKKKIFLIFFLFFCFTSLVFSQEYPDDASACSMDIIPGILTSPFVFKKLQSSVQMI